MPLPDGVRTETQAAELPPLTTALAVSPAPVHGSRRRARTTSAIGHRDRGMTPSSVVVVIRPPVNDAGSPSLRGLDRRRRRTMVPDATAGGTGRCTGRRGKETHWRGCPAICQPLKGSAAGEETSSVGLG